MPKVNESHAVLSTAQAAQLFKLLGDEGRLRILMLLAGRGEMSVKSLGEAVGVSQPVVSHHLTLLRLGGLVCFRREGKNNFYSLASEVVEPLLRPVKF
jgi:DNA-binding transcriptional ArsR family regulator